MPAYSVAGITSSYPERRAHFASVLSRNASGRERAVLTGVDFTTNPGELLVVLGEGGAGKSTLLRTIAGLLKPRQGRILEDGRDITSRPPHLRDMAMVFQNFSLYPRLSVAENLAFPLRGAGLAPEEIEKSVAETAHTLGLSEKLERHGHELSGGEMQRVALGRALVRKPKLFLLDEPLSNLDAKLREQMRAYIRRLQKYLKTTMLFVTHDHEEAMGMADRVLVLREGRLLQLASPEEIYRNPANSHVARMLGAPAINLLSAEEAGRLGLPDGAGNVLGIRPEYVSLVANTEGKARIVIRQYLGHAEVLVVEQNGVRLRALAEPFSGFREGEAVDVKVDYGNMLAFDS